MTRPARSAGGDAFVADYVCPDLDMRPLASTVGLLEQAGLEVRDVQPMREHYARTVQAWAANLERAGDAAQRHVSPGTFRVWRLYLAGARLAFQENRMGVNQIFAVGVEPDGTSGMPLTRDGWLGAQAGTDSVLSTR